MGHTTYCEHCGQEQEVVETVGWQSNVCKVCGNSIADDGSSPS